MAGKNHPTINMNCVEGVATDLAHLKQVLSADFALAILLAEVEQLCVLMRVEQVHEFLDPIIRNRKYPNLSAGRVAQALQKYER